MKKLLMIDASYGEGGGQILRTALILSLLTDTPFKMINIRKGRKRSGLKPQHLHIIRTITRLSRSSVEGASQGSQEITFSPGTIEGGKFDIDFHTAGSITLFLQTILPVSFFANSPVLLRVRGGTDVPMSMTWDYFEKVFLPIVSPYVRNVKAKLIRRGYYPKGGGEVEIKVTPYFTRKSGESVKNFLLRLKNSKRGLILDKKSQTKEIPWER